MPLAQQSIVDPGEVESKAPLKKSTVVWMAAGVLTLAVAGVFLPKFFKPDVDPAAKPEKPVGVGSTRQIDGEFEDAARRSARETQLAAQQQSQTPPLPGTSRSAPIPVGGAKPPESAASGGKPVVPPDVRRDGNSAVMYGRQMEAAVGAGGGAIEMDAAARNSASVKNDFSDSTGAASAAAQGPAERDTRLKLLLADAAGAPASAPAAAQGAAERIAAAFESQRRSDQPVTARASDRAWLKEFGEAPRQSPALKPYAVTNPYTLLQGKVLPAVLGGDLNTDLPGGVTAYVTENVYDSLSSRHLLIPRGAMLVGRYSNAIKTGQERILFAFERIVLPNGVSIDLPGFGGTDAGGAAGVGGDVNNHFFKQFGSSLLIALLADRSDKDKAVVGGNAQGEAISSAGKVLGDVSSTILSRSKSIDPTITVSKGTPILVSVAKDIEFSSPYRSSFR